MNHYLQVKLHKSLQMDVEIKHSDLVFLDLYQKNETNLYTPKEKNHILLKSHFYNSDQHLS